MLTSDNDNNTVTVAEFEFPADNTKRQTLTLKYWGGWKDRVGRVGRWFGWFGWFPEESRELLRVLDCRENISARPHLKRPQSAADYADAELAASQKKRWMKRINESAPNSLTVNNNNNNNNNTVLSSGRKNRPLAYPISQPGTIIFLHSE